MVITMSDTDVITPEVVETIDYAVRQTQLLEAISIDVHALVLITLQIRYAIKNPPNVMPIKTRACTSIDIASSS